LRGGARRKGEKGRGLEIKKLEGRGVVAYNVLGRPFTG